VNGKNINVKDGSTTYVVYSNPGNATCSVGDVLKVKGTICQYNGTAQLKAWAASDIVVVSTGGGGTGGGDTGGGTGGGDTGGGSGTGGGDTGGGTGKTVTFDLTAQGWANATEATALTSDVITFTPDKGTNNNAPKYYTSGNSVRFYGSNSFTISSSGSSITKIELTYGSGDSNYTNEITASTGSFASPTWTGSASSVQFTIGGTSGQRRIAQIVVTY
jgi:hypothetical protein